MSTKAPRRSLPQAQLKLQGFSFKKKMAFGGRQVRHHLKTKRAIFSTRPMHVILHSQQAVGSRSFLLKAKVILNYVKKRCKDEQIALHDWANAGNHLHMVIQVPNRAAYARFIRSISGVIARKTLGAERGVAHFARSTPLSKSPDESHPSKQSTRFWSSRPFTRVANWGNDYRGLSNYLMINRLESIGMNREAARRMLSEIAKLMRHPPPGEVWVDLSKVALA